VFDLCVFIHSLFYDEKVFESCRCSSTITRVTGKIALFSISCIALVAQQYVISTVAGGPPPTPAIATSIPIPPPAGIATDSNENIFVTSSNCIYKLGRDGIVVRIAGTGRPGFSGDGGPALDAQFNEAGSLALDGSGNLFVADTRNYRIRRISVEGIITTIAGNGSVDLSISSDGGSAVETGMRSVSAIAVNRQGEIIFADRTTVRKISTSGILSTIAGGGSEDPGDGGIAVHARLSGPSGLAIDGGGNIFVSDNIARRVRKIDTQGIITTVAGIGETGLSGDGGPATAAKLGGPASLAIDTAGDLYITDAGNYLIRKVSTDGVITTVAGGGTAFPGDGMPATKVNFCGDGLSLSGLSVGPNGILYVAACWIQKITPDGILSNIAGNGIYSFSGDGGPATQAQFFGIADIALDRDGSVFIADQGNSRIRKVTPDGNITAIAGSGDHGFSGDGGPATKALLSHPGAIALDGKGSVYFADTANYRIRKIAPDGTITTFAGGGTSGFSKDGTPSLGATVDARSMLFDAEGSLLFIEGSRIRKIGRDGLIVTIAGNGTRGFSGDGGPAVDALLDIPSAIALDRNNNLLIADIWTNRIRRVSPDGIISTVAGNGKFGSRGDDGDGGPALEATITAPGSIAADDAGNLFISGFWGLRRVAPNGVISTLVTNTNPVQSSGDGGPAALGFLAPGAVRVHSAGRVYVVDNGGSLPVDSSIRVLQPTAHNVLIAGVRSTPVSPGKIVTITGIGLGPDRPARNTAKDGMVPTRLAGTEVLFDGVAAPVLSAASREVVAVVPYASFGGTATLSVRYNGEDSPPYTVSMVASAPAIFSSNGSGSGQAAAINADGRPNSATNPVMVGGLLSLYATGEGQTSPAGVDGKMCSTIPPFAKPLEPVTVRVGGTPATVIYAGAAPGQIAGTLQVVVQIPTAVQPGGYVPVELSVGSNSTVRGSTWIAVSSGR
jgi:uncharacterized protein (TIGR03437 family)